MSLSDILGLGKVLPLDKLIDIVSKATGKLTKQYFDKKGIDTKAYEIKRLAQARAEEMKIITEAIRETHTDIGEIEYEEEKLKITSLKEPSTIDTLPSASLEHRTQQRFLHQQAKKQLNIESITSVAAEQLKDEPEIENVPVDEDWMNRFFNIAEDISNEELQLLWGKILAGEVKRPKSYSLRTLELIKNLSKDEADVITRLSNFIFGIGSGFGLFRTNTNILNKYGVTYQDIALLTELGIIQPGDFISYTFHSNPEEIKTPLVYGNLVLIITRQANSPEQNLPIYLLTKAGVEVFKLLSVSPSHDYLREIATFLKRPETTTQYGSIISQNGPIINHTLPLKDI